MRDAILLTMLVIWAAAPQKTQPTRDFHWNWRESKELVASTDSLATSQEIKEPERAGLIDALAKQFKSYPRPTEYAAKTRVKLIDLNGDGIPEAICQATNDESCSPTGNCSFWIYEKSGAGYKLILSNRAVQTFTIQNSQASGYHDLVLGMHGSATERSLTVFRFRDGHYRRTDCYDANWTSLGKDGEYHDLKEPRITRGSCS